ncbi:hypothetical protein [Nostoc sp.]
MQVELQNHLAGSRFSSSTPASPVAHESLDAVPFLYGHSLREQCDRYL